MSNTMRSVWWARSRFAPLVLATSLLGLSSPARAQLVLDEESKTVDGLLIYIGLLPAEMLKEQTQALTQKQMHGGVPGGKREYHFVVAIFHSETGVRVTDAKVKAQFSPDGLAGQHKNLEPMEIAGATTYGEFFDLPTADRYVIKLEVKRGKTEKSVVIDFVETTYHHEPGPQP